MVSFICPLEEELQCAVKPLPGTTHGLGDGRFNDAELAATGERLEPGIRKKDWPARGADFEETAGKNRIVEDESWYAS
jgi:hypothetical protein